MRGPDGEKGLLIRKGTGFSSLQGRWDSALSGDGTCLVIRPGVECFKYMVVPSSGWWSILTDALSRECLTMLRG